MNHQLRNILVLSGALILCGLVILWITIINKGTLLVEAEAPYNVSISPLGGSHECLKNSCEIKIKPGNYQVKLTKPEYFEQQFEIQVALMEATKLSHQFRKIPNVKLIGELILPELSAELANIKNNIETHKVWLDETKINQINEFVKNEKVSELTISPQGNAFWAKNTDDDLLWIKYFSDENVLEADIAKNTVVAWQKQGNIYLLHFDEASGKQLLRKWGGSEKPELLTSFIKEMEKAELFPSDDGKFVTIADHAMIDGDKIYLLDTEKKTKERIMILPNLAAWKWSPQNDYAVYQVNSEVNDLPIIYIYNRLTGSSRETRIPLGAQMIEWINNKEIAVFSNVLLEDYLTGTDENNIDSLSNRFKLASNAISTIDNDIILSYDVSNDSWKNLTQFNAYSLQIAELAFDSAKGSLKMLAGGNIYELETTQPRE